MKFLVQSGLLRMKSYSQERGKVDTNVLTDHMVKTTKMKMGVKL